MSTEEEKEVTEAVGRFSDAVRNQDIGAMEKMIPADSTVVFYGSQAGDKEVGRDDIISSFKEQFSETESMDSETLATTVSVCGDMAWVAHDLQYSEKGGNKSGTFESRWTCVVQRFPDGWKVVHMHHSVGR